MLFDLRGRGRRRTVRVIYIGLALLIGIGLVGFGVGGGFGGGGIVSSLNGHEGSGGVSYSSQISSVPQEAQGQPERRQDLGTADQNARPPGGRGSRTKPPPGG